MAEAIIYPAKHWVVVRESQDTGCSIPFQKAGSEKRKNDKQRLEFSLDLYPLNKMAENVQNMKGGL